MRNRRDQRFAGDIAARVQAEISAARVALRNGDADEVERRLAWIEFYNRPEYVTRRRDDFANLANAMYGSRF